MAITTTFITVYEPQTTKSSFIKVYGELLFFSFLPGLHIKTIFFIFGVAILLLVVIALYVDRGIPTTAPENRGSPKPVFSGPLLQPSGVAGQHHVPEPSHSLFPS